MNNDFFDTVIKLKSISRKGWEAKLGIDNPESVADHSYSMATMVMVLSDIMGLNTEKIMKMSLLHDLAETIIGDLTPDEIQLDKKTELENKAMNDILKKLNSPLSNNYIEIWQEFQEKKTNEAILVHECDKLEMAFQAMNYQKEGYSKEKIKPFIDSAKNNIKNKQLLEILAKLLEEKN